MCYGQHLKFTSEGFFSPSLKMAAENIANISGFHSIQISTKATGVSLLGRLACPSLQCELLWVISTF